MRSWSWQAALAFTTVFASQLARAEGLTLELYPDTVRLDLRDGHLLEAAHPEGPKTAVLTAPLALRAARDEVVAFQIAVRGAPGTYTATATAEGGVRAELFQARGIEVTTPSSKHYVRSLGAGLYPDPLIPTATVSVPAAPGIAMVWIDLWVRPEAAPGVHEARVAIADRTVDLTVEVLPILLPKRDHARLGTVNFGSFLEKKERDRGAIDRWMQLAHAHHLSVEVLRPTPKKKDDGTIDWDGWAELVGPYADGSAFTREKGYDGPRAGLPTTRWILPHTDWWPSAATPERLPSDPEGWSRALAEWERYAKQRGWLDKEEATEWGVFINSLDEPHTAAALESLVKWTALLDGAKLADRRHVWFRVDGPFGQGVKGWSDDDILKKVGPVADTWNVCGAVPWIPWWKLEQRRVAAPEEKVMFYASNTSGEPATPPLAVDSALAGARAWAWIVRRYDLDGAMNWEVDYVAGCAANPRCAGSDFNLDATLIFRGGELGRRLDEPIPSIRLKALRRGAQDVALLALLGEKDRDTAQAIADLVIPRAMGEDQKHETPGAWPIAPAPYDLAREAILDRLAGRPHPTDIADIRPDLPSDPVRHGLGLWLVLGVLGVAVIFVVRAARTRLDEGQP